MTEQTGAVRGIGWSITANLGKDRQIVLQSFFDAEQPVGEQNAMLDQAMRLVDRQQAAAERPELVKDLHKHKETLAQLREDRDRLEAEHPGKVAAAKAARAALEAEGAKDKARASELADMEADFQKLVEAKNAEYNDGFREWSKTRHGDREEYKPRGHRAANVERMEKAIAQGKEMLKEALVAFEISYQERIDTADKALADLEAERESVLGNLKVSETRYEQAIASLESRLAEVDKLLEG